MIISGNDENSILDTVILLPFSTDLLDDMFPYRLRIEKRDNLKENSDILINQIRTLSKTRIKEKIAKLSNEEFIETAALHKSQTKITRNMYIYKSFAENLSYAFVSYPFSIVQSSMFLVSSAKFTPMRNTC